MALQIDAGTNPALLKAVRAALQQEQGARGHLTEHAPLDPNHSPFGHVRLNGPGGFICGLCGRGVISTDLGVWAHR